MQTKWGDESSQHSDDDERDRSGCDAFGPSNVDTDTVQRYEAAMDMEMESRSSVTSAKRKIPLAIEQATEIPKVWGSQQTT